MSMNLAQAGAAQQNLALGKTYTLDPAPNYPLCTDDADATDLTDGNRATPREGSGLWGDKAAVGWQHVRGPITITIDLGKTEPIAGISFAGAAGSSGVSYPSSIVVQVSDDGTTFHTVDDLMRIARAPWPALYNEYSEHEFRTDQLKTRGRFLRLVVVPSSIYAFCDEIQVFRGSDELLAAPLPGRIASSDEVLDPTRLTQIGIVKRVRWDIDLLRDRVKKQTNGGALRDELLAELDRLDQEAMAQTPEVNVEQFRAVLPLNDLHRRVLAVYGRVLASTKVPSLAVWHTPPYQMLETFEKPKVQPLKPLSVRLLQNERRAEVFNITNASPEAQPVRFRIEDLPLESDPGLLTVYEVQSVDTREGNPASSALVPLSPENGEYTTEVPAGMTRQIWLSCQPTTFPAGKHKGKIVLSANGLDETIALDLEIGTHRMPGELTCVSTYWDYVANLAYGITESNRSAALEDMRRHGVNASWSNASALPYPTSNDIDAEGNLIGKIDYTEWDRYVRQLPGMKHYMVFAYKHAGAHFLSLEQGTPAFNRAVAAWARDWAEHNREIGLKPGQAMILIVDEPGAEADYQTTYLWAKAFNAGTDEILVFVDPVGTAAHQVPFAAEALAEADVICPNEPQYVAGPEELRAFYQQFRSQGKRLWLYSCGGPTRLFDPSYFRLQPWQTFVSGGDGSGFWAYGDNGEASSWNEYLSVGRQSFTPVYLSSDGVHTSKHWEAALEGLQDYEYLVILRARADELEHNGNAAAARRARNLLGTLPGQTLDRTREQHGPYPGQSWNGSSAEAERSRLQIFDLLQGLPN